MAGHEFAVVLDFGGNAELAPVVRDGADAVGADGDDLLNFLSLEGLQAGFGEGLEDEVVAQAARRIAGALLLSEDAEGSAEMVHDAGKVGDDLAAVGIVGSHAAEPEAVLLRPVEDGKCRAGDEFIALSGGQA